MTHGFDFENLSKFSYSGKVAPVAWASLPPCIHI